MSFAQVLLTNVSANQDTNQAILEILELETDQEVQYHVYEVAYHTKRIYCCLSGGVIEDNEIQFTPVGLGAFEALSNIDDDESSEYFAEQIELDAEGIAAQIEAVFERVPNNSRVCFVGNLNEEMRNELGKYFTLVH